jgi:hypothetical protein
MMIMIALFPVDVLDTAESVAIHLHAATDCHLVDATDCIAVHRYT